MMRRIATLVAALGGIASAACPTGSVGEIVRTEAPTASEALGDEPIDVDCRAIGAARPLIVDWSSQQRLDLELAMKRGVAVVKYDCDGIELLSSCALPGDYAFVGVSRKEDVIQLTSADELAANLPLSAVTLQGAVGRDSSLDLALVMVGVRQAAGDGAALTLSGRCDGATHFVRAATIGAFAMQRGSAGRMRAVADIFGAGAATASESSQLAGSRDGELDACRTAESDAAAPPDQCQAAVRLDLEPLREAIDGEEDAPEEKKADAPTDACPQGLVRSGGKCTERNKAESYLCDRYDVDECSAQCERGEPGSCYNLAALYMRGVGVEKDDARARELYRRACETGEVRGCSAYSQAVSFCHARKESDCGEDQRERLLIIGCDAGNVYACSGLIHHRTVNGDSPVELTKRACKLGSGASCMRWSDWLFAGAQGEPKDAKQAIDVARRACESGSVVACSMLSRRYETGDGVEKDLGMVAELGAVMCSRNAVGACRQAADLYRDAPPGVSKDLKKAADLYRVVCRLRNDAFGAESCLELARLLRHWGLYSGEEHTQAHADESMAAAADACHKGGLDCRVAAWRARERAFVKDREHCAAHDAEACLRLELHMYEAGCEQANDVESCNALQAREPARFRAVRLRMCRDSNKADSEACQAWVALGGELPKFD